MKKLSLYAASLILTLNSFSLNTETKIVADDINISTTIDTEDELLDATSGEIKEPIKVGKIKVKVLDGKKNFNDFSEIDEAYGGNQCALYESKEAFLKDKIVKKIIREYYPEATKEDMELLFYRMQRCGCGYVAAINTLMMEYEKYNAKDFRNRFGFNMKCVDPNEQEAFDDWMKEIKKKYPHEKIDMEPDKILAYNYLFLDFFLYYAENYRQFETIDDALGNTKEEMQNQVTGDAALTTTDFDRTGMMGTEVSVVASVMKKYLKENGIKFNHKSCEVSDLAVSQNEDGSWETIPSEFSSSKVKEVLKDGDHMIVGADNFNMYQVDDYNNMYLVHENVGGHAMTVVGITSDPNRIVVSSWGKRFIIDINDIDSCEIYDYGKFNTSKEYTSDKYRFAK